MQLILSSESSFASVRKWQLQSTLFTFILVTSPFAWSRPLNGFEASMLIINGGVVLSLFFIFLTIGSTMISSTEVSLFTLLETVLGPVWVWLGGFEAPPRMSIYGGALLITTLIIHR